LNCFRCSAGVLVVSLSGLSYLLPSVNDFGIVIEERSGLYWFRAACENMILAFQGS
jgi:hypothetical protein